MGVTATTSTLEAVRRLSSIIREHAEQIEQERSLPKPVIRGPIDAGVFRMLVAEERRGPPRGQSRATDEDLHVSCAPAFRPGHGRHEEASAWQWF
jgi:hypothetical protein